MANLLRADERKAPNFTLFCAILLSILSNAKFVKQTRVEGASQIWGESGQAQGLPLRWLRRTASRHYAE